MIYYYGQGVPKDYVEAAKWLRKASEQGVAEAQCFLGIMYSDGRGVPQDYVQAHKWLNLAASRMTDTTDRQMAVRSRNKLAARMTAQQIAQAQEMARRCEASKFKPCN